MGLSINTNLAALNAYQNLSAHAAELGGVAIGAPHASENVSKADYDVGAGDTLDITHANIAASQTTISDADLAEQVANMTASLIVTNPGASVAAQGHVSAAGTLALLQ